MASKAPPSVRYKNPGAQKFGPVAMRFRYVKVHKLGSGHTIVEFPSMVIGAAAMFYLLYTKYVGMTIGDALAKWGGQNNTNDYIRMIETKTHWTRDDFLTKGLFEEEYLAIEWGKAQAWHEAGQKYPMTDAEWSEAHELFMDVARGEKLPASSRPKRDEALMDRFAASCEKDRGQIEVAGPGSNPRMLEWYEKAGHPEITNDSTPNCAAAMCCWLQEADCANPKTLGARDFEEYGIELPEPEEDCIGVMWRNSPSSWEGHVGRVVKWDDKYVWMYGANQWNAKRQASCEVNVSKFPRSKFTAFRRPIPAVRSVPEIMNTKSMRRKVIGAVGTFGMLVYSTWNAIAHIAVGVAEGAADLIGTLPETADTVTTTVRSGETLAGTLGVPWPFVLTLFILFCSIVYNGKDTFKRLRNVNPWAEDPA